jgi:hypothetical protein
MCKSQYRNKGNMKKIMRKSMMFPRLNYTILTVKNEKEERPYEDLKRIVVRMINVDKEDMYKHLS